MKIDDIEYESIILTDLDNRVLAVISDQEIIEHEGCKVILEPTKQS